MAKLLTAVLVALATVSAVVRGGDDLTSNLLAGQAPFATGYWKEINMPDKSLRFGAHSNAGYTLRYLPEADKPQQPTIGRALGYKCLGTNSYFVLYEEVSFPKPLDTGIYRKVCSLRRINGDYMTYIDVEADGDGKCDGLKDYLEESKGRRLLDRRPGRGDSYRGDSYRGDSKDSRRRRAATGTLVRLPSPDVNSVLTTCTTTTYVPPVMVPLSTAPYPLPTSVTPCTTYTFTSTEGPGNVQGLWATGSKKGYVLETISGFGTVTWPSNNKPERLSMNDGFYTASACPTAESTLPNVVASYTQSYFQRRYIDGTIDAVDNNCRIKYRDLTAGTLTVNSVSQFLVENLPGNPDLTCSAEEDDDDDRK